MIVIIVLLAVGAVASAHAQIVLTDRDASVAVAAAYQAAVPSLIGADGPLLTQVEAAQKLGLSGRDVTVCVVDTGVDILNPNFGLGCPMGGPRNRNCRVKFGYDAETDLRDPTPRGSDSTTGHGTHVAGIALGAFPDKLLDAKGNALSYQRGVAFNANLGAIRATNSAGSFTPELLSKALSKTVREECDINNLSLGNFHVTPNPAFASGLQATTGAGIITTAAAGNDDAAATLGPRLFNTASPGSFPDVFAVAHLNNTANPGSLLELNVAIDTSTGPRNTLAAIQRADTQGSICSPSCGSLNFPLEMYLVRMASSSSSSSSPQTTSRRSSRYVSTASTPADCSMKFIFDSTAYKRGQVVVLQFDPECKFFHTSPDLWGYLRSLGPALVLMAMPSDSDAHTGALYYKNAQIPAMWMRSDDGKALSEAMEARDVKGMQPLKLTRLPGAIVVPMPDMWSGQPALTSAMGPAFDLSIKPDIACPGSLYSSLPNETYQTWPGTSMASPYMAGVLALWKERKLTTHVSNPPGGWVAAAFTAMKNTAKPIQYENTNLVWPPAKVGAGMVQAFSAVLTNVTVYPTELLMRTDALAQSFFLTVTNHGTTDVTYTLGHQPAVTLSFSKYWYNKAFDTAAPTAVITGLDRVVKVPGRSTRQIKVSISMPQELQDLHAIFSGYITLTPAGASTAQASKRPLSTSAPITLSVPYQGATRDYSTIGQETSLDIFVSPMPELHPEAARLIAEKPSIYVCDYSAGSSCTYNVNGVTLRQDSILPGFTFASTLLRPLKDVKIQVWTADGKKHLGTSKSLGPAPSSAPFRRTFLFEGAWDGSYIAEGQPGLGQMEAPNKYKLVVELWPVLAAADKAAGRLAGPPFYFEIRELVGMAEGVSTASLRAKALAAAAAAAPAPAPTPLQLPAPLPPLPLFLGRKRV